MKIITKLKTATAVAVASSALLCLTGCENASLQEKQKDTGYTDQQATAIEVGLSRVAAAILAAAIIRGIMNK